MAAMHANGLVDPTIQAEAPRKGMTGPVFFADAEAFRAWLANNAATASELLVGFHKVGSGQPCMSWSESVDEALASAGSTACAGGSTTTVIRSASRRASAIRSGAW